MEVVALGLAILGLLIALLCRARIAGLQAAIEETARSARRALDNQSEGQAAELRTLRSLLAAVQRGDQLTEDMILEGRLWRDVSPDQGKELVESATEVRILDVRSPQETAGGTLPHAVLIPVEELEERLGEVPRDGRTTLVYCAGGGRSAAACEFLSQQGVANLLNLEGGIASWPGPTVKP